MADSGTVLTRQLERLGRFSAGHRRAILAVSLVFVLAAGGFAATTVQLDMGVDLYLDQDSATAQHWERIEGEYDRGNQAFVVVETGAVTDPETVRFIDRLDRRYGDLDRISASRSLADVVRAGAGGRIPETAAGVERAIERVQARNDAARSLIGTLYPESGTALLVLSYGDVERPPSDGGHFDVMVTKDAELIEGDVAAATDAATVPADTSVTVTGASIFEAAAFELMLIDALTLFAGGFLLVFGVVYLVMRRRLESGRQAFFSLGVAAASVVVMLGAMGLLGYDFNAIMLTVLPVGLGLSVDYALQIQTRYAAERDAGNPPTDAAGIAARTTGRALALAMGTTLVGFGSLVVSPVPPVRQFGVTLAVNVLAAMLLSVTLLVAILVHADVRSGASVSRRDADPGLLERALGGAGRLAAARPLVVLLLLVPVLAGGAAAYPRIDTTQEMLDYWPQDLSERRQFEETLETVPSPQTVYVIVEADRSASPDTLTEVAAFQRETAALPGVNAVDGPVTAVTTASGGRIPDSPEAIRRLVARAAESPLSATPAPERHPDELLLTLYVGDVEGAEIRTLVDRVAALGADHLPDRQVVVSGKPVVTRSIIENVTAGLAEMATLSFGVAFLFLLVALRSPRDSLLLVLAVPGTAAMLVLAAMYLLRIPWNPGTVSMASIALGIGIDYGLHVHERYEEVRGAGVAPAPAMQDALAALSRPIVGSGLTTVAGFGVLVFSRFPVVRNFGKTLVLVVASSMFAAFVVLPTVVLALEGRVARRTVRRARAAVREGSMARDGDVLADPAPDDAAIRESPLASHLHADERIEYLLTTRGGGLIRQGAGLDRYTPGGGRAVAAVTDRGVRFVVAEGEADGTDLVETVRYPSVWTAGGVTGLRTSTLSVTTHADERYVFRVGGRQDVERIGDRIDDLAQRWTTMRRHVVDAEDVLEQAAAAGEGPDQAALDTARADLEAARTLADEIAAPAQPIHERIDGSERRLRAAEIDQYEARAADRRRSAESHRAAERYEAAHAAYVDARDALDRSIALAGDAPDHDVAHLRARRERIAVALTAVEDTPLVRARLARQRAPAAADPAAAIAAWEEALDRLRTALYLAWGESPFAYDVDALRFDVERTAAIYIEALRERAAALEAAADDGGADRREGYAAASAYLQRARAVAAELRAGDLAAIDESLDRIEAKKVSVPRTAADSRVGEGEISPW